VLDGELAVPCNLQSAIAGLNSRSEIIISPVPLLASGVDGPSPAQWKAAELRQDREVAAVGGPTMCRGFAWLESTAFSGSGYCGNEDGCTAVFFKLEVYELPGAGKKVAAPRLG